LCPMRMQTTIRDTLKRKVGSQGKGEWATGILGSWKDNSEEKKQEIVALKAVPKGSQKKPKPRERVFKGDE